MGKGTDGKPNAPVDIHDCVNFFWNPVNSTFDAYCRNAIILGGEGIQVAILEIPIAKLVDLTSPDRVTWASSKHNLASPKDNRHTSAPAELKASDWPWEAIFATDPESRSNKERKAEFICQVLGAHLLSVEGIPFSAVTHCIVADEVAVGAVRTFTSIPVTVGACFKPSRDLLDKDHKFIAFLDGILTPPANLVSLLSVYEKLVEEKKIIISVSSFDNQSVGVDFIHGVPHVSRVMFWSAILAAITHKNHATGIPFENFITDCIWAASIHDLCRVNNQEDDVHGEVAAKKYGDATQARCPNDALRVRHIIEAVAYHCRPDADYSDSTNIIYKVLKDADAIDRGRFSGPCSGTDYEGTGCKYEKCSHRGCAYKTLRFYVPAKDQFFRNIAWAAHNLAQSTKFAPWSGDNAHLQLVTFIRNAHTALTVP